MTVLGKTAQVLLAGATVAAGIVIAPMAAQASIFCDTKPDALYYDCQSTDTGNKTNMESMVVSDGIDMYVSDYANSWNRLKNWDLCTTILIYNSANVKISDGDVHQEHCYHMKKRDETTANWSERLTPYEQANIAYMKIVHSKH